MISPKQNKRFTSNHLLIILLALLLGVQVIISNKIATSGKIMSQLEQRKIQIEDDNRKLLSESVENFSLAALHQKAHDLGFEKPQKIIQINAVTNNLAFKY